MVREKPEGGEAKRESFGMMPERIFRSDAAKKERAQELINVAAQYKPGTLIWREGVRGAVYHYFRTRFSEKETEGILAARKNGFEDTAFVDAAFKNDEAVREMGMIVGFNGTWINIGPPDLEDKADKQRESVPGYTKETAPVIDYKEFLTFDLGNPRSKKDGAARVERFASSLLSIIRAIKEIGDKNDTAVFMKMVATPRSMAKWSESAVLYSPKADVVAQAKEKVSALLVESGVVVVPRDTFNRGFDFAADSMLVDRAWEGSYTNLISSIIGKRIERDMKKSQKEGKPLPTPETLIPWLDAQAEELKAWGPRQVFEAIKARPSSSKV